MPRSPSAFPVQPKRGLARQTEPSPESPRATFVRPSHFETRGIRIAPSALALASIECAECHRNQAWHGSSTSDRASLNGEGSRIEDLMRLLLADVPFPLHCIWSSMFENAA